jgi:hypothetical protein
MAEILEATMKAAVVEFDINSVLGQGSLVADIFVATGSSSPVIFATGGNCGIDWANIKHPSLILCTPHAQGNENGIRARIGFAGDVPPATTCQLSLMQADAKYFRQPVKTTPAP